MTKLPTFSHTKWEDHQQCPLKMKWKMIDYLCWHCFKGPVPKDSKTCPQCGIIFIKPAPLEKGIKFAKDIEEYLKGKTDVMPPMENLYAAIAAQKLRGAHLANPASIIIEAKLSFPEPEGTYNVYGGLDVLVLDTDAKTAQIIDWKTGSVGTRKELKAKAEAKYDFQLDLYATVVLQQYPWVEEVSTHLYFVSAIDAQRTDRKIYMRHMLPELLQKWLSRANRTMSDTTFEARKGYWCKWCPFAKPRGGPCHIEQDWKVVNGEVENG